MAGNSEKEEGRTVEIDRLDSFRTKERKAQDVTSTQRRTTELSWGESRVTEAFLESDPEPGHPMPQGIEHEKPFFHPPLSCREPYLQQMSHQYLPLTTNNLPLTFH